MKILSRYFKFILIIFLVLQGLILFPYPISAFDNENDNVSFDNNYSEVIVSDSDDSDITQTGEENDNLSSFSETESYSLNSVDMESSAEFESITEEITTDEDVYDTDSKKDYVQSHYDTSTLLDGNDDSGKEFITYYNDFMDVIEKGGEFTLTSDLVLTRPIIIEQDVVISGDYKINFSFSNDEPYLIKILANGSLTLNNVTIDGSNLEIATKDFCAVEILGDLTLNNANIMNFNISSTNGMHLVFVNGGNFVMNKGKISNNNLNDGFYHGVIGLENGATFLLDGGIISNNYVNDPQGASGIIYVSNMGDNNIFTMKDGDIFENRSCAVFVGSLKSDNFSKAQMIFDGGYIRSNHYDKSYYAGGIYVNNGEVIMNNGTIEGNTGQFYGGGISLVANPNATFIMNGGKIINNSSMYGGGIFVTGIQTQEWKANVQLNGGIIANNEATRQGGGIYVVRGQEVHLRNAVISENEASKLGGGIWTCSTGKLQIYITNGGAVFDNSANVGNTASAGDDLAFVKHEDSTTDFFLSQRVLGAGKIDYYLDGGIYTEELGSEGTDGSGQYYLGVADNSPRFNSYNPGEPISDVELNESSYALKSVLSDTAKLLASEKASLFITGNKADRGAGIGSNGNVIIGDVPNPDEGINEYSLSVRKEWDISVPEHMKEDIKVALVSDGRELDTIVLNEENEWTGEFYGLPSGSYTVKEVTILDNMVSNISKTLLDSENYTYEVVITNKLNLIEIPVKKVWEDDDNRDGIRPDVIKVYVYADSQKIDELNITSENNWSTVIKNLPATKNGVAINYTIRENDIDGYSSVITGNMADGFIITNSRIVKSGENQSENDSNETFTATDVIYQLVNTKDK